MVCDRDKFFAALYHNCTGKIEFRALPGVKRGFFRIEDLSGQDAFCRGNHKQNLYFGVATRDGQGGRKENIINIPCVWADGDFKQTAMGELAKNVKRLPFKPSAVILSGAGVHLYWILKEPAGGDQISRIEDINRRIARSIAGDMGSTDAAHILRIPGTINYKYPAEVKLHRIEPFTYELEDFETLPEVPQIYNSSGQRNNNDEAAKLLSQCRFISWCKDNPDEVSEPLWFALISNLITIRPGGASLAHELSKGYRGYTAEETDRKILHALDRSGPLTCEYIKRNGFDCGQDCGVKSPGGLLFLRERPNQSRGLSEKQRKRIAVSLS